MFKNYLKTAFRVFTRNKVFSAINVLGLSIGISAALIIFLIVQYEFSYDKVETDANRIYRVVMDMKFNGDDDHSCAVPAPLSQAIRSEIAGLDATVPVMQFQGDATAKVSIERGGLATPAVFKKQANIVFTNSKYFQLLPFEWLTGSPESCMKNPFNVVLTESRVRQYFPGTSIGDVIGKEIKYNDDFTATVSGIVRDLDARTSFDAVEFISFSTIAETHMQGDFMMDDWNDWMSYSHVYVKLAGGDNASVREKELNQLFIKYSKTAKKETYSKLLGFKKPDDALGELLDFNGKRMPIVGVLHDFNQQSFHSPVAPLVFASFGKRSHFIHVLLEQKNSGGTSWSNTISKIQEAFHKTYPDADLSLTFFDQTIAHFYEAELHTRRLLAWATGLSVLISCLGLLGLVMYTINTRTKEICIRKVLGASVTALISILSKKFVQLVLIAFFIAAPIAWWASHKWLEDFAYRTAISWWVFVLCCAGMLAIALITLSIQTLKAAFANPVEGLRGE